MRGVGPGHQEQIVGIARADEESITRHELAQFQFVTHPFPDSLEKGHNIWSLGFVHDGI
jgi:hypothetical protein